MFINFGDKNFFEYGCLVNPEYSADEVQVLYCCPIGGEEDKFVFADCLVDMDASWIKQKEVEDYCGCKKFEDPLLYAVSCIDFYGVDNFASPYEEHRMSKADVKERLKAYDLSDNVSFE